MSVWNSFNVERVIKSVFKMPGYKKYPSGNNYISDASLLMNDGTSGPNGLNPWVRFDRFYSIDLHNELPPNRHYVFVCRPDLYLIDKNSATGGSTLKLSAESRVAYDPFFKYLASFYPQIIGSLTGEFISAQNMILSNTSSAAVAGSGYGNSQKTDGTAVGSTELTIHGFIPFLTGRVESLQLPDFTAKQNNIVQPYTKYSLPYTTTTMESTTGGTFDITFREDRYYSIHKLFYAWLYYQGNVMRNIFRPKDKYLMYNAIDYATSIYDIAVDETGENIIYWAKYTGCVPTNVPMSDLSFNRGGDSEDKVTISFAYFLCEQMDRDVLIDFQYNSIGYIALDKLTGGGNTALWPFDISKTVPIYDSNTFLGKNLVGRPVIFYGMDKSTNKMSLKLRWLP